MAKVSKAARRKLKASLGDSWDDTNYSTDGSASITNHSEVGLETSDNEFSQAPDPDVPFVAHVLSPSSKALPKETITRKTTTFDNGRAQRMSNTAQPLTQSVHKEPSFIMPKLEDSLQSPNDFPSRRSKVRSRNVRNKTPHLRTSDRSTTSYTPSTRAQPGFAPAEQSPAIVQLLNLAFTNFLSPVIRYSVGVIGHAMGNLQPFFGLALAVGVLFLGIQWAVGSLHSGFTAALAPVCLVPGSSYIVPFCAVATHHDPLADFERAIDVQSGFEDIMNAAKDTLTLPSTIKDSEIAIRDLRTLVRHSHLPSRHQLGLEFDNFVLTANEASMDLSRFNSRIGATVDRIIATNTWTRNVLSSIAEREESYGAVERVYGALTRPFIAAPPTLQQRIFELYSLHVSKNTDEIQRLIDTAVALLSVLQNLDERLDTIHHIAIGDDATITKNQEELLAQLLTKLGRNNSKVNKNNSHLRLLKNISAYRKQALNHVSATLLKLREIQAELENLREGVAAPEVLGWRDALPITYHLDIIDKGVDRLKQARGENRRVESEMYRNQIRGGESGDFKELPAPSVVTAKAM